VDQLLVTDSPVCAIYDEGLDHIVSFWPSARSMLRDDVSFTWLETIMDRVAERFSLSVPVHTMGTLLESLVDAAPGRAGGEVAESLFHQSLDSFEVIAPMMALRGRA
jgi:hypothetical protein